MDPDASNGTVATLDTPPVVSAPPTETLPSPGTLGDGAPEVTPEEHIARFSSRAQASPWKVPELVAHLNLDRSTLYRYIRNGRLGAFRTPGGTFRIPDSEVQRITALVQTGGGGSPRRSS